MTLFKLAAETVFILGKDVSVFIPFCDLSKVDSCGESI